MAFESLTDKLQNVFKNLKRKGRLTEEDVKKALKEVKMALLEADVNLRVVRRFVNSTIEEAKGEKVLKAVNPGQQFTKIIYASRFFFKKSNEYKRSFRKYIFRFILKIIIGNNRIYILKSTKIFTTF